MAVTDTNVTLRASKSPQQAGGKTGWETSSDQAHRRMLDGLLILPCPAGCRFPLGGRTGPFMHVSAHTKPT